MTPHQELATARALSSRTQSGIGLAPSPSERSLLSARERLLQRDGAIAMWERAKGLCLMAEGYAVVANSRSAPRANGAKTVRVDRRGMDRVDEMIGTRTNLASGAGQAGVGLVLARRISRVAVLHDALKDHLSVVWSAWDPFDGIGLAIVNQPDLTLVDDDLSTLQGADAALLVRAYVPRGRVVLFSECESTVTTNDRQMTTCPAEITRDHLREVLHRALAT